MFTRTVPLLAAAAMLIVLSAGSLFAQGQSLNDALDGAFGSHDNYRAVINRFQAAVKAHDTAAVAAAVRYPIGVEIKGKASTIKSASQFVQNYDAIMTREITDAVVNQKLDDLFVNWKGIMFGNGQIWINGVCNDSTCKNVDIKVATIQSTASIASLAPSGEMRCGWIENPTPGDLFLIDKDATWTITSQGPPMRPGSTTSLMAIRSSSSTPAAAPAMATAAAVFRSRQAPKTSASPRRCRWRSARPTRPCPSPEVLQPAYLEAKSDEMTACARRRRAA